MKYGLRFFLKLVFCEQAHKIENTVISCKIPYTELRLLICKSLKLGIASFLAINYFCSFSKKA